MRWLALSLVLFGCGGDGGDDGQGSQDAGTADAPPVASDTIFDESQIRTFNITVADADWDFLNENALLEQYVPGDLEYDGETFTNLGVRYKGAVGSLRLCFDQQGNRICDKLSFKLKFSEYDPDGKFHGLKRINLHSMNSDSSKMHDAIGYKLFRDFNVYAPRTAYARVVINGELIGLFIAVEVVDGRFARLNFPEGGKGNVYKEVWPVHSNPQRYLDALKSNRDENPSVDKMIRFASDVNSSTEANIGEVLSRWTDVDMLMRYMAVARLIDHWDGIVALYCGASPDSGCGNHNYYWYESTTEDRFWLIPWDLDNTFQEPSPVRTQYGMPDWDDLAASCEQITIFLSVPAQAPSCDPVIRGMRTTLFDRYLEESRLMIDGAFSRTAINARIDQLNALISAAIEEDPDVSLSEWNNSVTRLRADAAAKRAYIETKFP